MPKPEELLPINNVSTIMNHNIRWPGEETLDLTRLSSTLIKINVMDMLDTASKWSSWNQQWIQHVQNVSTLLHSPHLYALLKLIGTITLISCLLSLCILTHFLPKPSHRKAGYTVQDLALQHNQQRLMRLEWLTSQNKAVVLLSVDPGVTLSAFTCSASHNEGNSRNSKADYTQRQSNLVQDRVNM